MNKTIILFLFLFFINIYDNAYAQIINVQGLLAEKPQQGFKINLGGSGLVKTGNVEYKKFSAISAIRYYNNPHSLIFTSNIEYAEKDDEPFWERYFEHLRYRYGYTKHFGSDVFIQHEYNKFKRFSLRMISGVGFYLNHSFEKAYATVGLDYMFEYNKYSENNDYADSGDIKQYHRADLYLNTSYKLTKTLVLSDTVYYQPEFTDFNNFLFYNEINFKFIISKYFSFTISYSYSYNATPPISVKKSDNMLLFSLNTTFTP